MLKPETSAMPQPPTTWHDHWRDRLAALEVQGRRRRLHTSEPLPQHRARVDGAVRLNLSSNDYLGCGSDPELLRAFRAGPTGIADAPFAEAGLAASASRLLSGEHPAYADLERALADAYGPGRAALVLNSGYHANIGILPALAERGDLICSDRLNHASLVDGLRLGHADWVRYRHNDLAHLRELLAARRAGVRRVFIVTESIFSMDGDCADLPGLVALKRAFDAQLYVDEAHAVGVRGPRGLGLCAEAGVLADADILVGTFGKALASTGAFAITAPVIRDALVNTMRSLIFTTALPPLVLRWTHHVFAHALAADDRRARLARLTADFRAGLAARGLPAGGASHIVPFLVGADHAVPTPLVAYTRYQYRVPLVRPVRVVETDWPLVAAP